MSFHRSLRSGSCSKHACCDAAHDPVAGALHTEIEGKGHAHASDTSWQQLQCCALHTGPALTSTMNSSLIRRHISRTKSAQGDIKYFAGCH